MNPVTAGGLTIGRNAPPRIMGVLNVSEESPYDPSVFTDPAAGARYVREELIAEGADIVDVGLASANKRFDVLTAAEELERLPTALEIIDRIDTDLVFSIETRYADVAEEALGDGFAMVNDVCGFADPGMAEVCDDYEVPGVKMAGPGDLDRPGAIASVDRIYDSLADRPLAEQTIIDPAFGGWSDNKDEAVDRETFRRLAEFRALDRPLLVSINRKNFLRHLADRSTEEALPVSLAATSMAVERGADVIRTHDVGPTRDAAIIGDTFAGTPIAEPVDGVRELHVRSAAELRRHLDRIGASTAVTADGTVRVFELRDLGPADQAVLRNLTEEVGATMVEGRTGEIALLVVTNRELSAMGDQISGEADGLERLFVAMQTEAS